MPNLPVINKKAKFTKESFLKSTFVQGKKDAPQSDPGLRTLNRLLPVGPLD